jgi:hypothetical protein
MGKIAKYCKVCGMEIEIIRQDCRFDEETGECTRVLVHAKCPRYYSNMMRDNGHYSRFWYEKPKEKES